MRLKKWYPVPPDHDCKLSPHDGCQFCDDWYNGEYRCLECGDPLEAEEWEMGCCSACYNNHIHWMRLE